jgi:hypothetical protein
VLPVERYEEQIINYFLNIFIAKVAAGPVQATDFCNIT